MLKIEPQKLYYNISEVSKLIGESNSLLRFWEKKISLINPKKNINGTRIYTLQDVKTIVKVHNLIKQRGFTIEGANLELKKSKTVKQEEQMIKNLQEIREFLKNLF